MASQDQDERRARIETAAYEVLLEKGYRSASMLAVARKAKASNETMYRWYGDKAGLFRALVAANAAETKARLEAAHEADAMAALTAIAPLLLAMVTGEKAVALNRAAAANVAEGGELGKAIAEAGRDTVAPAIGELIERAACQGVIAAPDPRAAADLFIRLLIGDAQIRRVIGTLAPLTDREIEERADTALQQFRLLLKPR